VQACSDAGNSSGQGCVATAEAVPSAATVVSKGLKSSIQTPRTPKGTRSAKSVSRGKATADTIAGPHRARAETHASGMGSPLNALGLLSTPQGSSSGAPGSHGSAVCARMLPCRAPAAAGLGRTLSFSAMSSSSQADQGAGARDRGAQRLDDASPDQRGADA